MRPGGLGRLPAWVVRMRLVLDFMEISSIRLERSYLNASPTVLAEIRSPGQLWALGLDGRPQRHERILDGTHRL